MEKLHKATLLTQLNQPYYVYMANIKGYYFDSNPAVGIIYLLQGSVEVETPRRRKTYKAGDLVILNPNEGYSFHSLDPDNLMMVIQVNINEGHELHSVTKQITFDEEKGDDKTLHILADAVAAMTFLTWGSSEHKDRNDEMSMAKRLMSILITYFQQDDHGEHIPYGEVHDQILKITQQLKIHKTEPITLQSVADEYDISLSYLSRTFARVIGVGLPEYVRKLRLAKAVELLQIPTMPISKVASESGFPSIKVMGQAFQSVMNKTPSQTRKQLNTFKHKGMKTLTMEDYLNMTMVQEFLRRGQEAFSMIKGSQVFISETKVYAANTGQTLGKLDYHWNEVLTLEMLGPLWMEFLEGVQRDLSFKYIRIPITYSGDEFYIRVNYNRYQQIELHEISRLLNRVIRMRLKPVLALDLMEKTMEDYMGMSINAMNKDARAHFEILLEYLLKTMGLGAMRQWHYELCLKLFRSDNPAAFHRGVSFYQETYRVLEEKLRREYHWGAYIGPLDLNDKKLLTKRCSSLLVREQVPKFVSCDVILKEEDDAANRETCQKLAEIINNGQFMHFICEEPPIDQEQPVFYINRIEGVLSKPEVSEKIIDINAPVRLLQDARFFWTERLFGSSMAIYRHDDGEQLYTHEDPKRPYWSLCLVDEYGIKMPAYFLYQFIRDLGSEIILEEPGCIITKDEYDYQIILYHMGDENPGFNEAEQKYPVKLELAGVYGRYNIIRQDVNLNYGNAREARKDLGDPGFLTSFETEYLKGVVRPKLQVRLEQIDGLFKESLELDTYSFTQIVLSRA